MPLLVASAWPVSVRVVNGAPLAPRVAAALAGGSLALTLVPAIGLGLAGALAGPSLRHGRGALETPLAAVAGACWGWRVAARAGPGLIGRQARRTCCFPAPTMTRWAQLVVVSVVFAAALVAVRRDREVARDLELFADEALAALEAAAGPEALPEAPADPEALNLGQRQRQIVKVPQLASEDGAKTADIAAAIDYEVPNTYSTLQALARQGVVELIPGRQPQTWRLAAKFRPSGAALPYLEVAELVRKGEWTTYGDVSIAVRGDTMGARAVGRAAAMLPQFP